MTSFKKLVFFSASLVMVILPLLVFIPRVSAAAAICIWNSPDEPNTTKKCSDMLPMLKANNINSAAADTCYYLDSAPMSMPTVSQAPIGSAQCKTWQGQAKQTAGAAPICFKVTGANVNVGTYNFGHVTPDMLKRSTCTSAMLSKQPAGSKTSKFTNGACYLVFANGSIAQDDCATILQKTAGAAATDANKTPIDAKAADNGPNGSVSSSLSPSQQQAEIERNCKPAGKTATQDELKKCIQENPLVKDINLAINLLSGLVGIIVVIMMIVGGIQYMTAGGNPQSVAVAKKRISNAALSIVALIFMFSFLQWLIPGGIF